MKTTLILTAIIGVGLYVAHLMISVVAGFAPVINALAQ
jgi:hypothetical protein